MQLANLLGKKTSTFAHISVDLIDSNPNQPRKNFQRGAIEELATSIKENGLICPISVRKQGDRYQLIAGERRLIAFMLLQEKTIPAIIEKADDERTAKLSLIENLQRCQLSFLEESMAIRDIINLCDLSQQQVADSLGISQSAVANKLRILKLPNDILEKMATTGLTERHARALLPLCQSEKLNAVAKFIIENQPTVSQTEAMVKRQLENPPKKHKLIMLKDFKIFTNTIDKAITVMQQAGIRAEVKKAESHEEITFIIAIKKQDAIKRTS